MNEQLFSKRLVAVALVSGIGAASLSGCGETNSAFTVYAACDYGERLDVATSSSTKGRAGVEFTCVGPTTSDAPNMLQVTAPDGRVAGRHTYYDVTLYAQNSGGEPSSIEITASNRLVLQNANDVTAANPQRTTRATT